MVHRKLDKVPGEMCAAADEDLWFRNMRRVRVWISGLDKGGGMSDAREEWEVV